MTTDAKLPVVPKRGRKKASRTGRPQSPHIVSSSNLAAPSMDNLTPDELKLIQLYRQMNDTGQETTLAYAENSLPAVRRSKPALSLVHGGAS